MSFNVRQSTGVPGLDAMLGGGLVPGTLTVVVGATGIGKTQLGLQFAHAGRADEGRSGVVFDMTSRGDAQSQRDYAERMFGWRMEAADADRAPDLDGFFAFDRRDGDYLHVFDRGGRRVTRRDLEFEDWQDWQSELSRKLAATIAFLYGNFVHGARRFVIDGVEPVERASDSIQLELFEYIYHQIVRKDPEWTARDLFRQRYREHAAQAAAATYDPASIGCMVLYTSTAATLDELAVQPLEEGSLLANANTIIYLGKIRQGGRFVRGLYVAKHRGSACSDDIATYTIEDRGLRIDADGAA